MSNTEKSYDLASFKRANTNMITKNTIQGSQWETIFKRRKNYTIEEVEKIINSNDILKQQQLSRYYYGKDGFYTRLINYYATLLKYTGILIPNPGFGKNLSTPHIQKRYFNAVDFVDKLNLPIFLTNCAQRALIDGCYYGLVQEVDKDGLVTLDLPSGWCRTRFKDTLGNDIIEFDVSYFNTIADNAERKSVLEVYPELISTAYKKWNAGKISKWVLVPGEMGICFPFFDTTPLFLSVIPATIHYDEAVIIERERDIEEIKKILVQKIPHLNDGRLVFEPDEAEEMHAGAVGMLQGNKNVSVLTTYADVEAIVSKTSSENSTNSIERMYQNVYNEAGTSSQLFASTGSSTLEASINNDTALMMALANKFALFVTNLINRLFANTNINFKYTIFPITYYNQKDYVEDAFKLAGSGYSFLMPALAMGFSQRELGNLKDLENDVLKLSEKLIPLTSSYTQSGDNVKSGRPEKDNSEKAGKTLENEKSKDNQTAGGSN